MFIFLIVQKNEPKKGHFFDVFIRLRKRLKKGILAEVKETTCFCSKQTDEQLKVKLS